MEKMSMQSVNKVNRNIDFIKSLFPNVVTEVIKGKDKFGNSIIENAIDFDKLKQELSGEVISGNEERYQFTWPNKRASMLAANAPISKTLRPDKESSVDFDTTENLYIEGDNLDALKLLQETYLNKVKMIYIDPPYNTGKDFVYKDKFAQNIQEYLEDSGQFDEEGNRLEVNLESNGRYHTNWLNMMYPRLKLAKDLLTDDGVIFISIDDNEIDNLKKICNEIFGEDNKVGLVTRIQKRGGNKGNYFNPVNDYILVYARNISQLPFFTTYVDESIYNKIETEGSRKGEKYAEVILYMPNLDYRPNQRFWVTAPDGSKIIPPEGKSFRWSKGRFEEEMAVGSVLIKPVKSSKLIDENGQPAKWIVYQKRFLKDTLDKESARPNNLFENFQNMSGSKDLIDLKIPFDYPKPASLMKYILSISKVRNDDIVLDFFAGSCSTAHAVMQLNAEDGGNRKFIMVQIPEKCDEKSEAYKAGYKNICEIGKERIRRAGKKIKEELQKKYNKYLEEKGIRLDIENTDITATVNPDSLDIGFRVFKVDSSNMKNVYYNPELIKQDEIDNLLDNIKEDRTSEDLLFQVMLGLDILLSDKIEIKEINNKTVYYVRDTYLIVCLDTDIDDDLITIIAKEKSYYAIFRDSSFSSDDVLTNVVQIFKTYSPDTIIKVI